MGQMLPTYRVPRETNLRFERHPPIEEFEQDDIVNRLKAREQSVRDAVLEEEKTRLVRDALNTCYKQYHVNHKYKCKPLVQEYLKRIEHLNGIQIDWSEEAENARRATMAKRYL